VTVREIVLIRYMVESDQHMLDLSCSIILANLNIFAYIFVKMTYIDGAYIKTNILNSLFPVKYLSTGINFMHFSAFIFARLNCLVLAYSIAKRP
jgi:hypothetical protein